MTTPAAQTPTAPGGREPIPPPTGGAPPGAPPEGAPFQSALDVESARTATAEGQQQSHSESPSATSHSTPVHRARSAGAGGSTVLALLSPSGTAVDGGGATGSALSPPVVHDPAATAPTAESPTANGPATNGRAANGPGATVSSGAPDTSATHDTGDGASALPAARELEGSPADAKGTDSVPGVHTGASPAGNSTSITESPPFPASSSALSSEGHGSTTQGQAPPLPPRPAAADATLGATVHPEGAGTGERGWTQLGTNAGGGGSWNSQAGAHRPGEQPGAHPVGATGHDKLWVPDAAQGSSGAGADSGAVATGGAGGFAESSASVPVSATGGANPSESGQQGLLLDSGVGLQQAIETLHGTIELAARQGLAQARIALEPEGLGEIRIHLTQTAQGLLARVTAETPVAAQALAAAHAELRQSLSSLGLNLARLSVGRHGHAGAQDGGTALGGGGRDGAAGSGEAASRGARSGQTAATEAPTNTDSEVEGDAQLAPAPARGTLVDVLA
jgi:Flagellar hook-length control protein FliK